MTGDHRISLAVIARDEARCITRCLESVRDHVDEMVVLDTGSTDDTVALAEAAGATVHHFTWVDDFSQARNAALEHCTGDWILVLDADEWLVSGAPALRSLRTTEPTFTGVVEIASPTSDDQVAMIRQIRVLPAGARYSGRIHEQPEIIGEERQLDVRLDHDGYLDEQRETKEGRNRRLLELALAEEPDDAFLWFQLAREYDSERRLEAALVGFERVLELTGPSRPDSPPWRHPFVVRYLACLVMTGRTQDAIDFAVPELEHWQHSADFQFMLGHALRQHALAHPELGEGVLPLAAEAWQACLTLGDSSLPGSILGHGSFLAARELVGLYESLGRSEDADLVRPLAAQPDPAGPTAAGYRISLAMIVRDEARCIVRCLDSVRDVVDEMIVVDTGSVDDTVALAEAAGATVHHFAWVDDFSQARNAALSHVTGDWILVIDADEWLVSGADALGSLRSAEPTFGGLVEIASRSGDEMVSVHQQVRVLPRGAHYTGRIHEQPVHVGPVRPLAVRIDHDGYMPEQREKKADRNQPLLEAALADEPDNAYLWFQLASEHGKAGRAVDACDGFERAYRLSEPTSSESPLWRHRLVTQYLLALLALGRTQDAIDLAFGEYEHWQHSADFQYLLGHALRVHGALHPEMRAETDALAEQAWQSCLSLGDSDLPGSVVGHGSFLAARELLGLYEALGREEDAARVRPLADLA